MFERSDSDANIEARVEITSNSTANGGTLIQLGRYTRANGRTATLTNALSNQTIYTINSDQVKAFSMDYTIVRGTEVRHGRMSVVPGSDDSTNATVYADDYLENGPTGITLSATQAGNTVSVKYTASNTGVNAILTYSIMHLA
jgi:hypothetical protein